MKAVFEQIHDLAAPYQDKRDDDGHARITLEYALQLLALEGGDEDIVIPAIMLHDIGWSRVLDRDRLFDPALTDTGEHDLRRRHQDEGVRLAADILKEVGYPPAQTEEILEIISEHDTRPGFISRNEGLVRDADKLWRFSATGFAADVRRFGIARQARADELTRALAQPKFIFSVSARRLAQEELESRRAGR